MPSSALPGFGADGRRDGGIALAEERYWDALVLGLPVPPPGVDATAGAVIQAALALDDAPLPDAAFAARLESQLLGSVPTAPPSRRSPRVGLATDLAPAPLPAGWPVAAQRRLTSVVAAAALLAIVLSSVFVMLRASSPVSHDESALPLVLGPGITDETLLLRARFETFPEGILNASVERWVIQPGAETEVGRRGDFSGEGPSAFLVEAGTLTVESDGPIAVTRSGASTPVTLEASRVDLEPGDRGFAPTGVASTWRNAGSEAVRIVEAKIRPPFTGFPPRGVLNYTVVSEEGIQRPERPIVANVYQITMRPEATLSADAIPGLEMLKVESGRLVAVDLGGDGQASAPELLGQGSRMLGSFPPGRVFRTGNDRPVTLILVTFANTNPLQPGA